MKKIIITMVLMVSMIVVSIMNFGNVQESFQVKNVDISVNAKEINKSNKYLDSNMKIPIISISDKTIEQQINKKIEEDIQSMYKSSVKETESFFDNFPDMDVKFEINSDFKVKKETNGIISILIEYYKYSGGAHGYYENVPYNIDITTGKFLTLEELFKSDSTYKDIINKEIQSQIEKINTDNNLPKESDKIYNFKGISDNQKFYLQDGEMVIFFDLYEIAPYVSGIPEFPIEINLLEESLQNQYRFKL